MTLRLLNHTLFSGSYNSQILNVIETASLEDLVNDLECNANNIFGKTENKIHSTLSKDVYRSLIYKVSNHLDGNLTRKTAEECRCIFEITRLYYNFDDIDELKFVYEYLQDHFKYTANPMPSLKKFKD
jgi:hypothetical protein